MLIWSSCEGHNMIPIGNLVARGPRVGHPCSKLQIPMFYGNKGTQGYTVTWGDVPRSGTSPNDQDRSPEMMYQGQELAILAKTYHMGWCTRVKNHTGQDLSTTPSGRTGVMPLPSGDMANTDRTVIFSDVGVSGIRRADNQEFTKSSARLGNGLPG
jgi:hypothetical protein